MFLLCGHQLSLLHVGLGRAGSVHNFNGQNLGCNQMIYRSVYAPTLNTGQELWVVLERSRLRIQEAEMRSLDATCILGGAS